MNIYISPHDWALLPFREDLTGTPVDGQYYRIKGEEDTVVKARLATDQRTVEWDAFPRVGHNTDSPRWGKKS